MLTYDLAGTGLPLYDALYRAIKEDILAGRLPAGEKLPSKRMLAQHLRVSVVTVQNAYAQLVAEGYLSSREKKGYFVENMGTSLPAGFSTKKERTVEDHAESPGW
ncbi:MAG: winged helix-turn-helix transcriptional regulator, partial [Clostridia bacterium]|nr:winged helix-turn-helix transcriptional regulator [Clostridia bacterium]